MTLTVFKYPVRIEEGQNIKMPTGAKLLSLGAQAGDLFMWALVNPEASKVMRRVSVVGTGWLTPELSDMTYISTYQTHGLSVWHLFDGGEVAP
jgi:hypothetical protein